MYTAHLEYVSQFYFCFTAVCSSVWCTQTNQPANSLQGRLHACPTKEKPTFLVVRKNTATFKHYKRIQQVFVYVQISQCRPFQEGQSHKSVTGGKFLNFLICF